MVNTIPSAPEASALSTFMPKPSPITEYCSIFFDIVLLKSGKALPNSSAKAKPMARAIGDETQPTVQLKQPKSRWNTSTAKLSSSETPSIATITM